ncbi:MAG TPA: GGDEF domain-containing protein [Gammaproteobacteria bacterium]|nr:GGDEF domain-containing protein [Gammaproteobacteria bacterium]
MLTSRIYLLIIALLYGCNTAQADTYVVSTGNTYLALGTHLSYLQEQGAPLSIEQAINAQAAGKFRPYNRQVFSAGIGVQAYWLSFAVNNPQTESVKRRLVLETSWMDEIAFYVISRGALINQQKAGDLLPFAKRPVKHRFFVFDAGYPDGVSRVFIRIATPDPMVAPMFFGSVEASAEQDQFNAYTYGLLYGLVGALLLYNLLLFFSIRQSRYFYYVIYLAAFLLMNLSYTGHGYALLWPGSPWLQQWINPIAITLFSVTGIAFAFVFLNIRRLFPRLFLATTVFCWLIAAVQLVFMMLNMQAASVALSIGFAMFFSLFTFYCAIISFRRGYRDALYYLVATVATLIGSALTAATVWGLVPYNILGYRAAEIAVSFDALLLSLALAEQIRRAQKEKTLALQMARIDMLTSLNNRRAFNELSRPLWHNSLRYNNELCIIILDIDRFKSINDTYGHAIGDQVLRQTALTLIKVVREADILVRWGGEEFAILLPHTSLEQATILAERIRKSLAEMRVVTEQAEVRITASLGVALRDNGMAGIEQLMAAADQALYQAKNAGRNRVCRYKPPAE